MPKYHVGNQEEVEKLSEVLPEGIYECEVFSGEEKLSERNNIYMAWQFTVVNHIESDFNGRRLFYNTPLDGKGRAFLDSLYKGCGVRWSGDSVDLPEDLLGRTLFCSVKIREFEGKKQNEVKSIIPKQ